MVYVAAYHSTPGERAVRTPRVLPSNVAGVTYGSGRPTLLMFLHPRCPCSRASLEELERLMAMCPAHADVTLIFMTSPADADWSDAPTRRRAERIAGVRIVTDGRDGALAKQFDARTSGQTYIYDAHGNLIFSGGLTGARAHVGDNAGLAQAIAILRADVPTCDLPAASAVFGCAMRHGESGADAEAGRKGP